VNAILLRYNLRKLHVIRPAHTVDIFVLDVNECEVIADDDGALLISLFLSLDNQREELFDGLRKDKKSAKISGMQTTFAPFTANSANQNTESISHP
jgi:hypothetical protein